MSTKSHIIVRYEDNSYEFRFVHWDGYIRGVGAVLENVFSDPQSVKKIFAIKSDFSSLINRKGDKSSEDEKEYVRRNGGPGNFHELNGYYLIDKGNESAGLKSKCVGLDLDVLNNRCVEDYTYLYDMETKSWFVRHYETKYEDLKTQLFIAKLSDLIDSDLPEDVKSVKIYNKVKNLSNVKLDKILKNTSNPAYAQMLGDSSDGLSPKLFAMVEKVLMDKEAGKSENMKNNSKVNKVNLKV